MRYLDVNGLHLSKVGLGTWQFGSREWGYGDAYAGSEAHAIVRRALDMGVTLFDTAEIYATGRSERILGEALGEQRGEVVVATKLFPVAPVPPIVRQRVAGSARRLGLDRIPLYQVHWPNPVVPTSVVMRGMREALDAGRVEAVGVSNYSLRRWQTAERELGAPVVSNQVQFSLAKSKPAEDLVPWAERTGRAVIAYSPLAQGLLTGRYDESNRPRGGVRAANPLFLPENLRRARPLLETLRRIAGAHDATPSQVALAWLAYQAPVVVIPGASTADQMQANAEAADLDLSAEEHRELNAAGDDFRPVSGPRALPAMARAMASRFS
ncbi:aldo/keto reductase [soil metagenome]